MLRGFSINEVAGSEQSLLADHQGEAGAKSGRVRAMYARSASRAASVAPDVSMGASDGSPGVSEATGVVEMHWLSRYGEIPAKGNVRARTHRLGCRQSRA